MDGELNVPAAFTNKMQTALQNALGALTLQQINTFAVANLLFPSKNAFVFSNASIPYDLHVSGKLRPPLIVTPATADVAPGGTAQFSCSVPDVLWTLTPPGAGTISATGLYTAPASIKNATAVVVNAIDKSDRTSFGNALAIVSEPPPANALSFSPSSILLTQGQQFTVRLTDASGSPVTGATCALNPAAGTIAAGWASGQWVYTAPVSVLRATVVTINATASSNHSGSMTVVLAPSVVVTITPSSSTVAPGGTVQLTATDAEQELDSYIWQLFPTGAGTISPNGADTTTATYTAAAGVSAHVRIVAYGISPAGRAGAAGVGSIALQISTA